MAAQLISLADQLPYLVRAIHALGQRSDYHDEAEELAQDLSSITAMVAAKFTNNRTAEGILEALRLTVGCISLGLAHAHLHDDAEAALDHLIEHGAERVFQRGFRLIKELSEMPEVAMLNAIDRAPQEHERRLRTTFTRYCEADANDYWTGYQTFRREWDNRSKIQATLECAKWLRKHHHNGAIRDLDMDADGVIAIALIFAIPGGGKIVAKAGQKDLEALLAALRNNKPDIEQSWNDFLNKIPPDYQPMLRERIEHLRTSPIITMLQTLSAKAKPTKAGLAKLFQELQNHGGNEIDVDYA
ncbi:MAG: hypothetical protein HKM01_04925 [Gallionella sp.]|nr:hypothetical protein [Gallionella sp.]